jgi:hypothetical protein
MKVLRLVAFAAGIAVMHVVPAMAQHHVLYEVIGGGRSESTLPGLHLHGTIGEIAVESSMDVGQVAYPGYWHIVQMLGIGPTTEVAIAAFDAWFSDGVVMLSWTIGAADHLRGINVYRAEGREEDYVRINSAMLPPDYAGEWCDRQARPGRIYYYQLGAIDDDGEFLSPPVTVTTPWIKTALYQNVPNPFYPATTISFYVPEEERITLVIYDVAGRVVRHLLDGNVRFGRTDVKWDGINDSGYRVGSGVYLCRLTAGKKSFVRKLTLLR